jgi:hypothetical protein
LATVTAMFNQGMNPATLTTATLQVRHNGTPLFTALTWDGAANTARAPAPLLPGETYDVEVSTGVATPGGAHLGAAEQWTFTTRSREHAAAGLNAFSAPAIAREPAGRVHVAYATSISGEIALAYSTLATMQLSASMPMGAFTSRIVRSTGRPLWSWERTDAFIPLTSGPRVR